jgi:CPA2 family monovalent cation:H+ antiporter-2
VFAVFFFVAIGTLIDPAAVGRGLPWLVLALVLVVVAKSAVAYGLTRLARLSESPVQVAVGLGQIGEFSFVLASVALARGAIDRDVFAAILAAVAISITGSTILVRLVRRPAEPTAATARQ